MIKKYEGDLNDIISILSELYGKIDENIEWNEEVLKCLSMRIEEDYYNERMKFFKDKEFNLKEKKLSWLYKNYCKEKKCEICPLKKYCNYNIKNVRESDNEFPTMIDLFCGAGGLSLGFVQAGFKIALANDIEECCIDTYSHNHPEVPRKNIVCGDINKVINDINELNNILKNT